MARTLIQTAQDLLSHAHQVRKALPPSPAYINTGKDMILADQHRSLEVLMDELTYFVDRWSELTGDPESAIPDGPTEEEVQTAIQSITGGTP